MNINLDLPLTEQRRLLRPLLQPRRTADAMAAYFAYHHPDERTTLVTAVDDNQRALAYMALSRTSIDLFRPFVTLRLPITDLEQSLDFIYGVLQPGASVILNAPYDYAPLLRTIFAINSEEKLQLLELDQTRHEPIVNVLVMQSTSLSGYPRFVIRTGGGQDEASVAAAASLNWQSPSHAEIAVNTQAAFQRRGWGRSVVSAMVQHLLANGRKPLYSVAEQNEVSQRLATAVGFVDRGVRQLLVQGTLQPRP